jgi:hypothetical protein
MKKHRRRFLAGVAMLFGAAFLLGTGGIAQATTYTTTIGGSSCLSCFGSVYTLTVTQDGAAGPTTTKYDVTYTVDTSGYNGQGDGLDAVNFKIATFNNIVSVGAVTGEASFQDTTAILDNLNANGCGDGGNSGFVCADSSNLGGVTVPDGTYTITFNDLVLKNGSLFTNVGDWSIRALYVHADGKQAGITSEAGRVPVPGTLLMFGLGFGLLLMWRHGFKGNPNALPAL